MMQPLNDNIVIRFKKNADELVTKSGIVLRLVEQDINIGQVVAVPSKKTYRVILRQDDGTVIRNEDGSPKEVVREINVNVGDQVIMEKKFHHDYDWHYRNRIDHTYFLNDLTRNLDDGYDYFLTKNDDILLVVSNDEDGIEIAGDGNVYGELFTQIAPKAIQKSVR